MSKVRYFFAIIAAAVSLILFAVLIPDMEFILRIIIGYIIGAAVGEFILFEYSLATRILIFLLRIVGIIFVFWIGWFASGIVGIIIGFLLASPLFTAMGAVFSFALSVFMPLSSILFPIHLVTYARWLD